MFLFVDGQPVVLRFNQVEQRYYAAFVDQFPEAEVSMSQWRGSYEYQTLYPAMQQMVENGALTLDALNEVLGTIAAANESIRRPAVLSSRVAERFKELGYEATSRVADATNKGIVAICVDQERTLGRTMTIGVYSIDADDAGYSSGNFGALSSDEFRGSTVTSITTSSDAASYVIDLVLYPTPEDTSDIILGMSGYINASIVMAYSSSLDLWQATDQSVASAMREGDGQSVFISFDGDDGSEAVNNDDATIGNLIRDEMLPVGQHMEGDIVYPTALSNGQPIDIKWTIPTESPVTFRVTIKRARGSAYPEHTVDQIIAMFNANYDEVMGIGADITPQVYLTVRDLQWASSVLVEWEQNAGVWVSIDYAAAFDHRYLATLSPANVVIV